MKDKFKNLVAAMRIMLK